MDLTNVRLECEGVDWNILAQDGDSWRVYVKTVMKLLVYKVSGIP